MSNGVLLTSDGSDPFLQTVGSYNVLVQYSQPVKSESTIIETGTSGLTTEESYKLMGQPDGGLILTVAKFLGLR